MDISKLKHNPSAVKQALKKQGNMTIALEDCDILIPTKYEDKELAFIEQDTHILAIYALVVGNHYAVSKVTSMIKINPAETSRVFIDDVEYFKFHFPKGTVIMDDPNTVIKNQLVYHVWHCFIAAGLMPWFLSYSDALTLFMNTAKDNGVTLGSNRAIVELIITGIARNMDNRRLPYRHVVNKQPNDNGKQLAWIPFTSIVFGPKTTTAKITGPYFSSAIVSMLNNPNDRPEKIESILRL